MPSGGRNREKSTFWSKEQMKEDDHEISKILNYNVITEVEVGPRQGAKSYLKEENNILSIGSRLKCLQCNFVAKSLRQFERHFKTHNGISSPSRARESEVKPNNADARISTFNLDQLNLLEKAPSSDVVLQDHTYFKPHQP